MPAEVVAGELDALASEYRAYLNKAHRETPHTLYDDVLGVLTAVGMVRVEPHSPTGSDGPDDPAGRAWLVHAAASRFAPRPEVVSTQASLFYAAGEEN